MVLARALGCLALCGAMSLPAAAEPEKSEKASEKKSHQIVTVLHRPPATVPSVGSQTAPVTIEFFCNFGDGTKSAQVDRLLTQLYERHPRRLRILYRLVGSGKQSNMHLEAAQEAFVQGRFRQFIDALFPDRTRAPRASEMADAAKKAGVDAHRIDEALEDARHAETILGNHYYQKRRRLRRVPGVVVNGEPYDRGQPKSIEELEALYDEAYARSKQLLDDGVEPARLYDRLVDEVAAAQPDPIIGPGAVDGLEPGERPPDGPPRVVSIAPDPGGRARGREDAPVPLVFFCNFQTRNCAAFAETLEEIAAAYPDEVRLVFRHFYDPDDRKQSEARTLGAAAWCADRQGRFWSYYELAFRQARQGQVPSDLDEEVAKALELDTGAFGRCMKGRETRLAVQAERRAARRAGIRHTPSLLLGGRLYTGTKSFDELSALIDRELMPGVLGRLSPD
jgi:protein-disulfide isomerase